ncbi:hypothetical protein [Latilactobacillus sakei]|uniref:hypothetical protein n=1 Tax=Latilactobacillus sakei TaxID=1599 RepID=UPI000C13D082|nr:hypothetical protein [Latilactobacillus sakei]RXA80510.1 hypothetical protein EQ835_08810 [Latilactobacillus sakei]UNC21049.1 hypothetical protein FXV74_03165 [Latilactobacillus sakei]UNC22780.1 hypothetical protein FX989_02270 [Latilactobacillus sakei]SOB41593.1 conserved hypothetical protein [Latilactobacillus sakei]
MKIGVQAFINEIQDQTYLTDEYEIATPNPFVAADFLAQLKPAVSKAVEKQALASFSALTTYEGEQVKVTLETGVVNLPLQYIKKVNQFLELEAQAEVNIYLYVTSPLVNRSGMRIDLIGTVADFEAQADQAWAKVEQLLTQDLEAVEAGAKLAKEAPVEVPKKAPAKKKAAPKKKTAAKKTTTKKKTTTTKKKPATKKTTTKKTAAKKTTTKKKSDA